MSSIVENTVEQYEKMKLTLQNEGAQELHMLFQNVLPWTVEAQSARELLEENTQQDRESITRFFDKLFLFKINEITITDTSDDIASLLYKKQQSLITAAYRSGFTLTTMLVGNGGGSVEIFYGVSSTEATSIARDVFQKQINGVFSGNGIQYVDENKCESRRITEALQGLRHGGMITGVPTQKIDDEKQTFDLTSIIRSMNGQKFVLVIGSRPISKEIVSQQIGELFELKDRCHALANRTVGFDQSLTDTWSQAVTEGESQAISKGTTNTAGVNIGGTIALGQAITETLTKSTSVSGGISLGLIGAAVGGAIGSVVPGLGTIVGAKVGEMVGSMAANVSISKSTSKSTSTTTIPPMLNGGLNASRAVSKTTTDTTSTSETETSGWSKSKGENLSFEQQNSLAMELELISDKLIKRLRAGLNTGVWENFITFATDDEIGSRVLSGTLCGELIKADQDALPVRSLSCELPNNIPLFLPKQNSANTLLKGNKLASFISSDEAALLMSPPLQSVPGFDIRVKPSLSLTDQFGSKFDGIIASIAEHGRSIEGSTFSISKADIRKHIFVTGITGCGKTTTVKQILKSTKDTPFLILESAKREYRRLLQEPEFPKLEVYTLGDSDVSPLRHNPFMVLPGVSLITHIDNLKSIFNASFSLYGPMPHILEKCLFNVYKNKGWNITTGKHHLHVIKDNSDAQMYRYIYPTIIDLTDEISRYVETIGYAGEVKSNIKSAIITRLEALAVGSKGFLFNTTEFLNLSALLNKQVIFELESLADDDDKAFFVGLMLALVSEYRQSLARESVLSDANKTDDLRHIIVVEEAHRLLKNVSTERTSEMMGNPKGKAVESFCNIIAEMRSLGQGVIVAEQIPTKIAPDVIKNTNTKIVHRLVSFDDQVAIGAAIGLDDADSRYLNQLSTGFALVHKEGMSKPVEIKVRNNMSNNIIGDIRIRSAAKSLLKGDLEADLALHESELLWNKHVKAISIRLVNSVFLSKKELPELLPLAIREVKQVCYTEYVADKTIILALGHFFKSNMLSPAYDIANGGKIDNSAIDALERFWDEPGIYTLERLEAKLNQLSNVRGRILEITVNNLIRNKPDTGHKFSLHLNSTLLVEDDSVYVEIVDAIKKRLCSI